MKRWIYLLTLLAVIAISLPGCTAETMSESEIQIAETASSTLADESDQTDAVSTAGALSTLAVQEDETGLEASGFEQAPTVTETATPTAQDSSPTTSESSEDSFVEATPLTEEELAQQPPGQSPPGAGDQPDAPQSSPPGGEQQVIEEGQMIDYRNEAYQFALSYPPDFVLLDVEPLQVLPLGTAQRASLAFMNPDSAASDAVQYEIADFEVRVYEANGSTSLEDWLRPTGFLEGMSAPEPFQTAHVSGIKVCQTTMIAPGCTYFVRGNNWNYQLIAATLAGEAIFNSFMLLQ